MRDRDLDGVGMAIKLLLLSRVALMPMVVRFALTYGARRETIQLDGLGIAMT
ncbi:hypothetical protein [Dyella silvatica]|uniref:hypothetical protein n=1 Tax=Dyella silvatica TaxID=2992128 RepID=UPI002259EE5B|nr:hypothetical protein [Dyella silvatica]